METDSIARLTDLFSRLERAFPQREITAAMGAAWADALAGLPIDAVEAAVDRLIVAKTFPPVLAEIHKAAVEIAFGLPTPEAAWHQVVTLLADFPSSPDTAWCPSIEPHPLVWRVVRDVGGLWDLAHSENQMADRAHFLRLFEDLRGQVIVRAAADPHLVAGELEAEVAKVRSWRAGHLNATARAEQLVLPPGKIAPPPPEFRHALAQLVARRTVPQLTEST